MMINDSCIVAADLDYATRLFNNIKGLRITGFHYSSIIPLNTDYVCNLCDNWWLLVISQLLVLLIVFLFVNFHYNSLFFLDFFTMVLNSIIIFFFLSMIMQVFINLLSLLNLFFFFLTTLTFMMYRFNITTFFVCRNDCSGCCDLSDTWFLVDA